LKMTYESFDKKEQSQDDAISKILSAIFTKDITEHLNEATELAKAAVGKAVVSDGSKFELGEKDVDMNLNVYIIQQLKEFYRQVDSPIVPAAADILANGFGDYAKELSDYELRKAYIFDGMVQNKLITAPYKAINEVVSFQGEFLQTICPVKPVEPVEVEKGSLKVAIEMLSYIRKAELSTPEGSEELDKAIETAKKAVDKLSSVNNNEEVDEEDDEADAAKVAAANAAAAEAAAAEAAAAKGLVCEAYQLVEESPKRHKIFATATSTNSAGVKYVTDVCLSSRFRAGFEKLVKIQFVKQVKESEIMNACNELGDFSDDAKTFVEKGTKELRSEEETKKLRIEEEDGGVTPDESAMKAMKNICATEAPSAAPDGLGATQPTGGKATQPTDGVK